MVFLTVICIYAMYNVSLYRQYHISLIHMYFYLNITAADGLRKLNLLMRLTCIHFDSEYAQEEHTGVYRARQCPWQRTKLVLEISGSELASLYIQLHRKYPESQTLENPFYLRK